MQAFLDLDIRNKVTEFVDGRLGFVPFYDWATPLVWEAGSLGNPLADELAGEIGLRLAEYTSGYWTEHELKTLLRPIADEVEVRDPGQARIRATSAARPAVLRHSAALR
jgi:hypothetical protein